ncbi:MAG TPA: thioredoxin domain-containing protein [Gemmatimonadaceae bacterium]
MSDSPGKNADTERVTIVLRKAHIHLFVALVLGFGAGYATAALRSINRRNDWIVQPAGSAANSALPLRIDVAGRPSKGPQRAPVTIVEFTDYQCPYCKRQFYETYDALLALNGDQVRYVVRNFPVSGLHPDAQKAAEAAECAFEQGKFWEYHDALFELSPAIPRDTLTQISVRLGLDRVRFDRCLDSGKKEPVVQKDLADGGRYGVRGTPTFFVNGRMLAGTQPISVLQAEIDRAIQRR